MNMLDLTFGFFLNFFKFATDKQMSDEVTQEKEIHLFLNWIVNIIM